MKKKQFFINWKKTRSHTDKAIVKQKKNNPSNESHTIQCRNCQQLFTITGSLNGSTTLECPFCNHQITIKKPKRKRIEQKSIENAKRFLSDHFVELILLFIGLSYLIQPTMDNIKISFTLILIASILMFLMTRDQPDTLKEKIPSTKKPYFKRRVHTPPIIKTLIKAKDRIKDIPLSNRISIVLILWTLLLFVIAKDVEIYFILIFIGILITRELTDLYTTDLYKKRLNAYIIIFLLTYAVLIYQKIMEILAT